MSNSDGFDIDKFLLDNPNDMISLGKWQRTVNLLAKLFDAPAGFLVQYTNQGFQTTICSEQATNPYPAGIIIKPEVNIFCRKIVESGQQLYVNNAPQDEYWDTNPEVHDDGFCSYLGVPVFWPTGEPFGTFCVMDFKVTDYDETYFELIWQLKDILESDLSLIDLYQQVQQLALTDPLTELNNRRGFSTLATQRMKLAKRMGSTLGLFYIDVDDFKIVNDEHGHRAGDDVLKKVARAIENCTRQSDVTGRMGGDEFVALVLLTHQSDLDIVANRLTQAINVDHDTLPEFTATVGATLVDSSIEIEQLLELADKDMLMKKQVGKRGS